VTRPIDIVIPVRDDARRLERCLAAIRASDTGGRCRIIVADNGSTDASPEVAARAGAEVLALPGLSVARLRNAAAGHATGDLLAFIDADHLIDVGWMAAVVERFDDRSIAAAGAPYASPPDANPVQRAYARLRRHQAGVHDTDWLGSGNLVVRRRVFEEVGGFDVTLETCEDVDLCQRLKQAGHRLVSDDRLKSVHLGDPRSLRAVFLGELWRGRDNFRVTMRGPRTARAMLSLLIPMAQLACLIGIAIGAILEPFVGVTTILAASAGFAALTALHAARMLAAAPVSPGDVPVVVGVAVVYDCARALALVWRATHGTRRDVAVERANA
jgi:Glycosyl transferase family 2